jgi:hypothetical protein
MTHAERCLPEVRIQNDYGLQWRITRDAQARISERIVDLRLCDGLLGDRDESLVPAVVSPVAGRAQNIAPPRLLCT